MLFGNVYLEAKPIKNLLLRSVFGIDYDDVTKWAFERTYQEGFLSRKINFMERLKGSKFNWTGRILRTILLRYKEIDLIFSSGWKLLKTTIRRC